MTGQKNYSMIELADRSHPAWRTFYAIVDLDRRAYDARELSEAWRWFRTGWDAKIGQLQAASTDAWCDYW